VADGALFTITAGSGSISRNKVEYSNYAGGGGVFVTGNGSRLLMKGGRISDNEAHDSQLTSGHGGGVHVHNGAVFTMDHGAISGNHSRGNGGGVYVSENSSFIMRDGSISGNHIDHTYYQLRGPGVFVDGSGYFIKSGGVIYGAANAKNDAWEDETLQNYFISPIPKTTTLPPAGYSDNPAVPAGPGKGYAVQFGAFNLPGKPRDYTVTDSLSTNPLKGF
jgi:hypothetical protein